MFIKTCLVCKREYSKEPDVSPDRLLVSHGVCPPPANCGEIFERWTLDAPPMSLAEYASKERAMI